MATSISKFSFEILKKLVKEKETFVDSSSNEAIENLSQWFQQIINNLIETQVKIIDEIEKERDRAKTDLFEYEKKICELENVDVVSIESKFVELKRQIIRYDLIKEFSFPKFDSFRPHYKFVYETNFNSNDDDLEEIPLPPNLIFASGRTTSFSTETSPSFTEPSTDDDDHVEFLDEKNLSNERISSNHDDFLIEPTLYQRVEPRRFDFIVDLIASSGADLL